MENKEAGVCGGCTCVACGYINEIKKARMAMNRELFKEKLNKWEAWFLETINVPKVESNDKI